MYPSDRVQAAYPACPGMAVLPEIHQLATGPLQENPYFHWIMAVHFHDRLPPNLSPDTQ
jgi:hypothetical protein